MATQILMDHSGDTRHEFDAADLEALAKAEQRFKKLTGKGFTAAIRTGSREVAVVRAFDPTAQETLFHPPLVGGWVSAGPCFCSELDAGRVRGCKRSASSMPALSEKTRQRPAAAICCARGCHRYNSPSSMNIGTSMWSVAIRPSGTASTMGRLRTSTSSTGRERRGWVGASRLQRAWCPAT